MSTIPTGSPIPCGELAAKAAEHPAPIALESTVSFADLKFPTSSGKVELYSEQLAAAGLAPPPGWADQLDESPPPHPAGQSLHFVTGAAPHLVTISFDNLPGMLES